MFQVKYVGDSLEALVNEGVTDATHDLMEGITHTARSVMFDVAVASTPIGRTAALRASWLAAPVSEEGGRFTTSVFNDHWAAMLVNYGADPHVIRPRTRRAVETPFGPRADVDHPGFHGRFMAEKAVDTTAQVIRAMSYGDTLEWKRRSEFAIERAKAQHRIV
jgi:hypothetical protein